MSRIFIVLASFLLAGRTGAQELYIFSEPASNMPTKSMMAKFTSHLVAKDNIYGRFSQRYMPEVQFGISKKWMAHFSATFADMHTDKFRFESAAFYTQYRFFSSDDLHKHFRMAVFADASVTQAPFHYDEISLMGDKSGVAAGVIATQLWHKLAVSATVGHTQVLDKSRNDKVVYIPERGYQAMNYSLSAGYLLLPMEYKDYRQTNLNLYIEMLAQQTLDTKKYFVDMAPAIQLIFNSSTRVNVGYRFQLGSDMDRMANRAWLVSFERLFLNALKKK